jgi:hypothetical protein
VKFDDIPTVYNRDSAGTHFEWIYFFEYLENAKQYGFELEPEFQRARVWTEQQQIAYIEHVLRNGYGGKDIYFNRGSWCFRKDGKLYIGSPKYHYEEIKNKRGKVIDRNIVYEDIEWQGNNLYCCVDGLQRITAAKRFMNNEIPAYGYYLDQFEDKLPRQARFVVHYGDIDHYPDLLQWYLELNSTGVPHTQEELNRVRNLLESVKS